MALSAATEPVIAAQATVDHAAEVGATPEAVEAPPSLTDTAVEAAVAASEPVVEVAAAAVEPVPQASAPAAIESIVVRAMEAERASLAPNAPIAIPPGDNGLVKIETDPSKLAQFGTGAPEEPVRLGRKPRPAPVIIAEPLQQVETHK